MNRFSRAGVHLGVLAAFACSHARPVIPPPREPLTPSTNEPFRHSAPQPLDGLPTWTAPAAATKVLANGMRVVVVERHERPIVSVRYANRAAARDSTTHPQALSVLVGDALLEGTLAGDEEVIKGVRVAGMRPQVLTSHDGTVVRLDVLSLGLAPAVQVIADMVRRPELSTAGIKAAANRQLEWIFESSTGGGIPDALEMSVLYGRDNRWSLDPRASQRELEALTTDDVERYHQKIYVPEVSALIVVGDVIAEKVFALAEQHFGDWPAGRLSPESVVLAAVPQKREVHALWQGGEQTRLVMVQPAVSKTHPDYHAFGLIAAILDDAASSRANVKLRHELGATYGVHAQLWGYRAGGYLWITATTENSAILPVAAALRADLKRLQLEEVSATELEAAKNTYLARFELTSTRQLANVLAGLDLQNLPPEWLTRVESEIAAITPARIRALANAHFDPDRASIIATSDLYFTARSLRQLGKLKAYGVESGR